jgi:hypothetical protein
MVLMQKKYLKVITLHLLPRSESEYADKEKDLSVADILNGSLDLSLVE